MFYNVLRMSECAQPAVAETMITHAVLITGASENRAAVAQAFAGSTGRMLLSCCWVGPSPLLTTNASPAPFWT